MKRIIQLVSAFAIMTFLSTTAISADKEYVEGKNYRLLKKPIPTFLKEGQVGVIWEVFSYSCGHCFNFEPYVKSWLKTKPENVVFEHVPVYWNNPFFATQAKAFYAAKFLKAPAESHDAIFNTIHTAKKQVGSLKDFANIYANYGVDSDKFMAMAESFAVQSRTAFAESVSRDGEVEGTPNIIVNGKYLITGEMAGTNQEMLNIALYLVEKDAK
ncbi:thiol:disulfide interchange protein DsbA/DsbL [Marinicellulosiphila megalodicopiae]|uniref:thiol:disulfide interchange protein DsbA/DsbL n=1 Tax=Marinicellulosiphila megalodicopiae TaxID=2724896 RepID=UPI003BB15072